MVKKKRHRLFKNSKPAKNNFLIRLALLLKACFLSPVFLIQGYFRERAYFKRHPRCYDILYNRKKYPVRPVHPKDLDEIARIENELFQNEGDDRIDRDGLKEWLDVYPDGGWLLTEKNDGKEQIIGAIGIWPLTSKAFHDLRDGRIHEGVLTPKHMTPSVGDRVKSHPYWYIGSVETIPELMTSKGFFVRPYIFTRLLIDAVTNWLQRDEVHNHIQILAVGFTDFGRNLLNKFDFTEQIAIKGHHPRYCRETNKSELQQDIDKYSSRMTSRIRLYKTGILALRSVLILCALFFILFYWIFPQDYTEFTRNMVGSINWISTSAYAFPQIDANNNCVKNSLFILTVATPLLSFFLTFMTWIQNKMRRFLNLLVALLILVLALMGACLNYLCK